MTPMRIDRRFTTPADAYPGIEFVERPAGLHGRTATIVAPAAWSQISVDTLAGKYFRRAGVPAAKYRVNEPGVPDFLRRSLPAADCPHFGGEHDARQVFDRLAGCWAYWAFRLNYFGPPIDPANPADAGRQSPVEAARAYYDEMRYMLAAQMFAPASPQWFNTGLFWAYGIEGPDNGQYAIEFDGLYPDGKRSGCPVYLFQDGDPRPGVRKHHEPFERWEERKVDGNGLVRRVDRAYTRPAAHACFILGVDDNLVQGRGICDTQMREARVFKFGGGAGANFSKLRGEGEPLSGGGCSSGLLSWLRLLDAGAGAIKSAGTTRRAAKMVIVDDDHPDLEAFIDWKVQEEFNVAALYAGSRVLARLLPTYHEQAARAHARKTARAADLDPFNVEYAIADEFSHAAADHLDLTISHGTDAIGDIPPQLVPRVKLAGRFGLGLPLPGPYSTDFIGKDSAYPLVSGQNANNSVRVRNAFLAAVDADADWTLTNRTDGKPRKTVKARVLWRKIVEAAWYSADPGVQFHDTVNEHNTCLGDGVIVATNPCAEYHFLDDTACNLGSHRLVKFARVGPRGEVVGFDVEAYRHSVRLATVALDVTVSMAAYPSADVAEGSRKYRTIGLGYADLGAFLMRAGVAYDSPAGRSWCAAITSLMNSEAYRTSAEIAAAVGPFPRYGANAEHAMRVVRNHAAFAFRFAGNAPGHPTTEYRGLTITPPDFVGRLVPEEVRDAVERWADDMVSAADRHGLRNAQATVLAPTGTIGLVLGCDTTGIEPDFALVKTKTLVGGGYMRIINQSVPAALAALGYSESEAADILAHVFGTRTLPRPATDDGFGPVPPGWCVRVGRLARLGLTADEIAAVEHAASGVDSLDDAIRAAVAPSRLAAMTGNTPADMTHPDYSPALALLTTADALADGLTDDPDEDDSVTAAVGRDLDAADRLIFGTGSVEGAPHLKPAHYAVFDCATPVGSGTRALTPDSHVWMMAAAQPSLSGAISKTINMPADASPDDVGRVYRLSHALMCKAVALYPDGAKLSQPLAGSSVRRRWAPAPSAPTGGFVFPGPSHFLPADPDDAGKGADDPAIRPAAPKFPSPPAPVRHPLPGRRPGVTQHFLIGGQPFYLRTGEYPDGSLGEIFLTAAVEGSTFQSLANAFAIAVSVGLQHGIPIEGYAEKWLSMKFEPNGIVQGHDRIKMAGSFLAAVGRDLLINYRGRDELADVQPAGAGDPTDPPPEVPPAARHTAPAVQPVAPAAESRPHPAPDPRAAAAALAKRQGYSGRMCAACGSFRLKRTGQCYMCEDCKTDSGCG